jgi:hypothetical protein
MAAPHANWQDKIKKEAYVNAEVTTLSECGCFAHYHWFWRNDGKSS